MTNGSQDTITILLEADASLNVRKTLVTDGNVIMNTKCLLTVAERMDVHGTFRWEGIFVKNAIYANNYYYKFVYI